MLSSLVYSYTMSSIESSNGKETSFAFILAINNAEQSVSSSGRDWEDEELVSIDSKYSFTNRYGKYANRAMQMFPLLCIPAGI